MGGKKNRNKKTKVKKTNEDGSQPLDTSNSFISQGTANNSFIEATSPDVKDVEPVTVTPEASSVANEGGNASISVSIIYLRFLLKSNHQIVLTFLPF